jgi:cyclic-di-GMP-binding protein
MADSSFDIASKIDAQEVDNAVNQAIKEINHRYDLKDSNSEIKYNQDDSKLTISASDEFKVKAVYEVLKQKMVKRNISIKALKPKEIEKALGGTAKQEIDLQQGISKEKAKDIVKDIKNAKLKVQAQIQNDQIRVSAKKKDDLQSVITLIKNNDYDIHVQFLNYR